MTPADTPTPRTAKLEERVAHYPLGRAYCASLALNRELECELAREKIRAEDNGKLAHDLGIQLAEVRRRAQWTKIDDANPDSVPKEAGWFIVACRVPGSEGPGLTRQDFYSPALSEKPNGPSRKVYGKYSRYFEGCRLGYVITHWQPLPKPPTQEALAEFGEVAK